MKRFKAAISVVLIGATMLSIAGCGKKFNAIERKDFEAALEETFDLDDDEYDSVKKPEDRYDFSYYSDILDATNILDDYKIDYEVELEDGNTHYYFVEFKDAEDAVEYFTETFYEDYEDMIDDKDFDGSYSAKLTDTMGYILLNGESDSRDFFDKSDIYGGIYVKDNIFVAVYTLSDKKSDIEDINEFLDAIGYPKP